MSLPILSYLYTKEDKALVLERLLTLEQSAFNVNNQFETKLLELFPLPIAESIRQGAQQALISLSDGQQI